jgi:hypothetical protein
MASCAVYYRRGKVYVVSSSITVNLLWVEIGPTYKVESAVPEEIGNAVMTALRESKKAVPDSSIDFREVQKNLLRSIGAKSWSEVVRTFARASVEHDGRQLVIQKHRAGESKAFYPEGRELVCQDASPCGVGTALIAALTELDPGQ